MKKFTSNNIRDNQFVTIHGWMCKIPQIQTEKELITYALIYGFSQTEEQYLTCRLSYIAAWIRLTVPRCSELLKKMENKGLIKKLLVNKHGAIKRYKYCCVLPDVTVSEKENDGFQKRNRTVSEKENVAVSKKENANIYNNKYNNNLYIYPPQQSSNQFMEFMKQDYDIEQLELDLLNNCVEEPDIQDAKGGD